MGSDSVPVLRERRNNNFLDLIEDFCHALADWRANANQISALNEHFGFKFTGDRNGLLTGPSIIAIMLAHRLIEPDNISALIHLADVAGRPDLKDLLNGYTYAPSLVTCQTENLLQNHEDGISTVTYLSACCSKRSSSSSLRHGCRMHPGRLEKSGTPIINR